MTETRELSHLTPGMVLLVGDNRSLVVTDDLAAAFRPGDSLAFVESSNELLHIPRAEAEVARSAVTRTTEAFVKMGEVTDEQISAFFRGFSARLADDAIWGRIQAVNDRDVAQAKARGRSTTRLEATAKMRGAMIEGLSDWAKADSMREKVIESIDHGSWRADLIGDALGVVAFIFEGRPNVVADATGVLRGGNTVVFRIGRDALETAKCIIAEATAPALREAGLPEGAVTVVDSTSHAAGWALFRDRRLGLAVARGSGAAVATLGSLAQSAGIPVSLHGTGGAWICASSSADAGKLTQTVADSLDRKVCNTLNTCCIVRSEAGRLVPSFLAGLERAAERRDTNYKLHIAEGSQSYVPAELFEKDVVIGRAEGNVTEKQAQLLSPTALGHEWEWEDSPEVTLIVVDDVSEAVRLFNAQSPRFVASLLSEVPSEHDEFFARVNAPFVGDGFTRWVDGQYALKRPELGLSNWENGRLFGRGGVLSGDSVFTVRTRVRGTSSGKPKA